ncbi:hypothetical protein EE612_059468 [Oryza sativa]|nr:hypothetical protein EE612_059468 [Oryza sativa]
MGIEEIVKISLLALGILFMATWVPHMYSFMRALFMVYLPSFALAIVAPKCLFIFSNIIVVFLVGESKFGHPKVDKENVSAVVEGDMVVHDKEGEEEVVVDLVIPAITGDDQCEELEDEEFVVLEEQVDALLSSDGVEIDQIGDEGHDLAVGEVVISDMMRKEEEGVVDQLVLEDEEVLVEVERYRHEAEEAVEERDDLLPADELNRRVEEFIARFNMERQLEARMLVCCC